MHPFLHSFPLTYHIKATKTRMENFLSYDLLTRPPFTLKYTGEVISLRMSSCTQRQ